MIEVDPIAKKFPDLPAAEFKELVESIKRDGLNEPIVMHNGKCIEGRHRLAACYEARLKPTTIVYHGDESAEGLARYVWAANGLRRHLSANQRAEIALSLFSPPKSSRQLSPTNGEVAEIAQVSQRTVERARKKQREQQKPAEPKPEIDKPRTSGKIVGGNAIWGQWEDAFGKLKRMTGELGRVKPAEKFSLKMQRQLNEVYETLKEWRSAVR